MGDQLIAVAETPDGLNSLLKIYRLIEDEQIQSLMNTLLSLINIRCRSQKCSIGFFLEKMETGKVLFGTSNRKMGTCTAISNGCKVMFENWIGRSSVSVLRHTHFSDELG